MPYTTEARIEALVGDLFEERDIDASTVPTSTQVTTIIADVEAELEAVLDQNGYTVPVTAAASPRGHPYLVAVATYGVAVVLLRSLPAESYSSPGEELPTQGRAQFFESKVKEFKKMVADQEFPAVRTTGLAARIYAGSQEDRDTGNTKLPIFTRSSTDYPGSRTLEES